MTATTYRKAITTALFFAPFLIATTKAFVPINSINLKKKTNDGIHNAFIASTPHGNNLTPRSKISLNMTPDGVNNGDAALTTAIYLAGFALTLKFSKSDFVKASSEESDGSYDSEPSAAVAPVESTIEEVEDSIEEKSEPIVENELELTESLEVPAVDISAEKKAVASTLAGEKERSRLLRENEEKDQELKKAEKAEVEETEEEEVEEEVMKTKKKPGRLRRLIKFIKEEKAEEEVVKNKKKPGRLRRLIKFVTPRGKKKA